MADSDKNPKSIYERLRAVQTELVAPKTQDGRFGKHRNVEDILSALNPLLEKHGLTLTLNTEIEELNSKNYVKATAKIGNVENDGTGNDHTLSVDSYAMEGEISRGLDAPQVTGAAISYARKYALGGLFAIDDGKGDPDAHKEPAPEKPTVKIATGPEKFKLQQMMKEKGMETADEMTMFIVSVINKKRVETHDEFVEVYHALTDGVDDQPTESEATT